jgi:hypothetical protein
MSDHKKKGDFHKTSSHTDEVGGNKKAGASPKATAAPRTSRTPGTAGISDGLKPFHRHCEPKAKQSSVATMDCFAALAMTNHSTPRAPTR